MVMQEVRDRHATCELLANLGVTDLEVLSDSCALFGEDIESSRVARMLAVLRHTSLEHTLRLERIGGVLLGGATRQETDYGALSTLVQRILDSRNTNTAPTATVIGEYLGTEHGIIACFEEYMGDELPEWFGHRLVTIAGQSPTPMAFAQNADFFLHCTHPEGRVGSGFGELMACIQAGYYGLKQITA